MSDPGQVEANSDNFPLSDILDHIEDLNNVESINPRPFVTG